MERKNILSLPSYTKIVNADGRASQEFNIWLQQLLIRIGGSSFETAEDIMNNLNGINQNIVEINYTLDSLSNGYQEINLSIQGINNQLNNVNNSITSINTVNNNQNLKINKIEEDIEVINTEITELKNQINSIAGDLLTNRYGKDYYITNEDKTSQINTDGILINTTTSTVFTYNTSWIESSYYSYLYNSNTVYLSSTVPVSPILGDIYIDLKDLKVYIYNTAFDIVGSLIDGFNPKQSYIESKLGDIETILDSILGV